MGYGHTGLTFKALRSAGQEANKSFNCDDWTASDYMTALVGEVGEAANLLKKVRRGNFTLEDKREAIAKELADVQIYLDKLAAHIGVDLGQATQSKFNEVAVRVGSRVRLENDDWHYVRAGEA